MLKAYSSLLYPCRKPSNTFSLNWQLGICTNHSVLAIWLLMNLQSFTISSQPLWNKVACQCQGRLDHAMLQILAWPDHLWQRGRALSTKIILTIMTMTRAGCLILCITLSVARPKINISQVAEKEGGLGTYHTLWCTACQENISHLALEPFRAKAPKKTVKISNATPAM